MLQGTGLEGPGTRLAESGPSFAKASGSSSTPLRHARIISKQKSRVIRNSSARYKGSAFQRAYTRRHPAAISSGSGAEDSGGGATSDADFLQPGKAATTTASMMADAIFPLRWRTEPTSPAVPLRFAPSRTCITIGETGTMPCTTPPPWLRSRCVGSRP